MATTKKKKKHKTSSDNDGKLELAESKIFDASEFEYLKALLYGKPKRGKTTLAATAPKPIIIDCNEKGTISIRDVPDVKVFRVGIWSDIDLAKWYLYYGNHDRETAVIDTLTSLAHLCMQHVLGREGEDMDYAVAARIRRQDWGDVADLMRSIILDFRNLPMNVIFIAQEKRGFSDDEEEDTAEIFPAISPAVRDTLTAAVDIIGRLTIKEVLIKGKGGKKRKVWQRRLLIGDNDTAVTGERVSTLDSALPKTIKNPNLSKLIAAIKGE
jgi:hypothetical protein